MHQPVSNHVEGSNLVFFATDQVSLVLEMLKKNHDANVGVSWDTIEATIDTVCK